MDDKNLFDFIRNVPKTELHLHIEGTFEPELMFEIAKRNGVKIKFSSVEEIREAYSFGNLQDFLDIYYEGARVLQKEVDFFDLTMSYLERMNMENVVHTEIFFDPQTHTERGLSFDTVICGIHNALKKAQDEWGMTSRLILCFLRHLDEQSAFNTLDMALPYKEWITGIGLDSSEMGHPPSKFERVFRKARNDGFRILAHAGEEGPASYIWEALDILGVDRIDHGNRCLEDNRLVDRLLDDQMALTLCPLSNLALCVINRMEEHPVKKMLDKGLLVTINSDDPAYFGGYLTENYLAVQKALDLGIADLSQLVRNSFLASFLPEAEKKRWLHQIEQVFHASCN